MLSRSRKSPVRLLALVLCAFALAAWFAHGAFARQTPQEQKRHGDALWAEKSYALAREEYQKALAGDAALPDKAEIELRIAIAYLEESKWQEAEDSLNAVIKKYADTPIEARAQVWRGRYYVRVPHHGYRVGKKIFRGNDVPKSEGSDAPVAFDMTAEDAQKTDASWERAKQLFEKFRREKRADETALAEEISLNFDIASLLTPQYYQPTRADLTYSDWRIDPAQSYVKHWPHPKRVLFLYDQIAYLDHLRGKPADYEDALIIVRKHHDTVLSILAKAAYIVRLRSYGQYLYTAPYRDGRGRSVPQRPVPNPLPYLEIDPIKLLLEALEKYPNDTEADRLAYTAALWTEQKGDAWEALRLYNLLLARYPKSRYASDAEAQKQDILRPTMTLNQPQVSLPNRHAAIYVSSRNVKQIRFTAYKVRLEDVYGKAEYNIEGNSDVYRAAFDNFGRNFTNKVQSELGKHKFAEWTVTTADNGRHASLSESVTTPFDAAGAYYLVARSGDRDEVGASTLVIVSDLTIVQKIDRDSVLIYAANAITGKPVAHVNLTVWAPVYYYNTNNEYPRERKAQYLTGTTNDEGQCRITLPEPADANNSVRYVQREAETFAAGAANRYAVTQPAQYQNGELAEGEPFRKGWVQTDRPLYRPSQVVNYRIALAENLPAEYKPGSGTEAKILIRGPHGDLRETTETFAANGTISGSYTLAANADLGDYYIMVTVKNQQIGAGTFRIEEYKKPEYTVSVQPEKSQVRTGEPMRVNISAKYFFGGPVMRAKVHYRVFRRGYQIPLPFGPRLAWYDEDGNGGNSQYSRYSEERIATQDLFGNGNTAYREGDLTTDEKGEAHLTFPTTAPKVPHALRLPPGYRPDQNFVITADVVDDSRREVSGTGSATATANEFQAFMRFDRNWITAGDTLKIEVQARDGGNNPFAALGHIRLLRLIPAIPEIKKKDPNTGKWRIIQRYVPPREEPSGILTVQTDAAKGGVGYAFWNPDLPGEYRLDYEATDRYGNKVVTSGTMLVYGPDFDSRLQKNDGRFTLTPEQGNYRAGDTARVLLVAPVPNAYVLLTEAVAGHIQRSRTIFIPGRSTVVNVPISASSVPNLGIEATIVYKNYAAVVRADVGVPAEDRILSLKITPDKAQYLPGEKATFKIEARDSHNRPVKGAFSLAVVDKSLLAIQPDLTPDIRNTFYGFRLQTTVAGANSLYYAAGQDAYAAPYTNYERHELVLPEGMGWLRDYEHRNEQIPNYVAYVPVEHFARKAQHGGGFGGALLPDGITAGDTLAYDVDGAIIMRRGSQGGRPGAVFRNGRRDKEDGQMLFKDAAKEPADAPAESAPISDMSPAGSPLVEAVVRKQFADTAFWLPNIETDGDGTATVSFDFPGNITQWDVKSMGLTADIKVGVAQTETVTKKNILVRIQAPRFFVERDKVVVSANVHNYLAREKNVRVQIVTDSSQLELAAGQGGGDVRPVTIKANDEMRLDWTFNVRKAGPTHIKVVAQTDEESDAAELTFPALVHGVEKFLAQSGSLHDGGTATLTLDIPAQRRKGATLLDVQMQPSLAATLIDALPYLEDYPYGCLEQTLSRFVPTVLTAKALRDAGVDLEGLGKRSAVLEEQRKNIPPQQQYENSGYTYPQGKPGVLDASALAQRMDYPTGRRSHAPLFNSAILKNMVDDGLQRIERFQKGNGGFGWWEGSADEDGYLTAYVVDGLLRAKQADVAVKADVLNRAVAYLDAHVGPTEDLHLKAYYLYVLTENDGKPRPEIDFLYERRDRLNAYGQALLAISLHHVGNAERANVILRNLVTTAKIDRERGSAHWESDDKQYWKWYNDKQETTAMVLRAFVAIAPNTQIAPENGVQAAQSNLAALAVRWLVDNRRGSVWTSTRQTANVVGALLEYAKAQQELAPDYTVTVNVDGKVKRDYHITKENALLFDNRFLIGDEILGDGAQSLHITMQGKGALYYSSYLSYFDLQEPIKGAANAIGVDRTYYKITPVTKKNKGGEVETSYTRTALKDGASLVSGDIIEVELHLKSDNDYDYLVFEDMKPAGCEAVETRSGTAYGDGLCSNFELRDTKVAFFVDHLPQGERRITYRLRAEIPGSFHALPTNAYAFYTPDIRALSDEWRVTIADAPTTPAPKKRR